MQSLIVLALLVVFSVFGTMQYFRGDPLEGGAYRQLRAEQVAGNIMQYNDLVYRYASANYESLHPTITINPGVVEQITQIENTDLAPYNQKNLELFLDYASVTFNYSVGGGEILVYPILYLATTWSNASPNHDGYAPVGALDIMGQFNIMFSQHIYQGASTYWTTPWLLRQSNCDVQELYGQAATGSDMHSKVSDIKVLFSNICQQIIDASDFKFAQFVYIQPVYKLSP